MVRSKKNSEEYYEMIERLALAVERAIDQHGYQAEQITNAKWLLTLPNGEKRQVDLRVSGAKRHES